MLQELQDVEDSVELHEVCTKIRESICRLPTNARKTVSRTDWKGL